MWSLHHHMQTGTPHVAHSSPCSNELSNSPADCPGGTVNHLHSVGENHWSAMQLLTLSMFHLKAKQRRNC